MKNNEITNAFDEIDTSENVQKRVMNKITAEETRMKKKEYSPADNKPRGLFFLKIAAGLCSLAIVAMIAVPFLSRGGKELAPSTAPASDIITATATQAPQTTDTEITTEDAGIDAAPTFPNRIIAVPYDIDNVTFDEDGNSFFINNCDNSLAVKSNNSLENINAETPVFYTPVNYFKTLEEFAVYMQLADAAGYFDEETYSQFFEIYNAEYFENNELMTTVFACGDIGFSPISYAGMGLESPGYDPAVDSEPFLGNDLTLYVNDVLISGEAPLVGDTHLINWLMVDMPKGFFEDNEIANVNAILQDNYGIGDKTGLVGNDTDAEIPSVAQTEVSETDTAANTDVTQTTDTAQTTDTTQTTSENTDVTEPYYSILFKISPSDIELAEVIEKGYVDLTIEFEGTDELIYDYYYDLKKVDEETEELIDIPLEFTVQDSVGILENGQTVTVRIKLYTDQYEYARGTYVILKTLTIGDKSEEFRTAFTLN